MAELARARAPARRRLARRVRSAHNGHLDAAPDGQHVRLKVAATLPPTDLTGREAARRAELRGHAGLVEREARRPIELRRARSRDRSDLEQRLRARATAGRVRAMEGAQLAAGGQLRVRLQAAAFEPRLERHAIAAPFPRAAFCIRRASVT